MHAQASAIVLHAARAYDVVFGPFIRSTDREIIARAGVGAGDRVVDVGTGPGYLALAASRLVGPAGTAMGIDASPEMIHRARARAAEQRATAEYRVAAAESLPFEDDSFDVAVSRLVFHHLPAEVRTRALREIGRVLRPGGRLLVADIGSRAAGSGHHLAAHVLGTHPEPEGELQRVVWDAGFRDVTCGPLMHGFLVGVAARRSEDGE